MCINKDLLTKEESPQAYMPEDKHDWVGAINTNSGKTFDIVNPKVNMIDIQDIAHALAMQCRYNGHVPSFYSVAEHSVRVSDWLIEQGYFGRAFAGLMHDAAEAYIGDIVRPMKELKEFGNLYKEFEKTIEWKISDRFGVELYPMNEFVKKADKAVYQWEVENIRSGNVEGWSWKKSKDQFLERFNRYCKSWDVPSKYTDYEDLPICGPLIIDNEVLQMREDALELKEDMRRAKADMYDVPVLVESRTTRSYILDPDGTVTVTFAEVNNFKED